VPPVTDPGGFEIRPVDVGETFLAKRTLIVDPDRWWIGFISAPGPTEYESTVDGVEKPDAVRCGPSLNHRASTKVI
jgi:hypothetical protein